MMLIKKLDAPQGPIDRVCAIFQNGSADTINRSLRRLIASLLQISGGGKK
jgi:hypothetical protein